MPTQAHHIPPASLLQHKAQPCLSKGQVVCLTPHNARQPAPTVSVIINCHNGAQTLPDTLTSLAAQIFTDYEVIFWDNASTDTSLALARKAAQQHAAFYLWHSKQRMPLGQARNCALAKARGEFIAFLDSDDLWLPEKLQEQVRLMRRHSAVGLVCTDARCLLGNRLLPRTFFQRAKPERGMVFAQLMLRQWVVMSSALVRRTVLDAVKKEGGWFDGALRVCEEADLFYRMARIAPCDYVAAPLTIWRVHGNNATLRNFDLFAQETRSIVQKLRRLFPYCMQQHQAVLAAIERRATIQQALALWRAGQGAAARGCLRPLHGTKIFAVTLCTWLPPCCFDWLARLYWRWR